MASTPTGLVGWMCNTAPSSLAFWYSGQNASSARAVPLTLLNSMAPGRPNCRTARSSSATEAGTSLSGSVARAVNRWGRRPGRLFNVGSGSGEREHLQVHTLLLDHLLPVPDVAMAAHGDVVVPRVM